MTLVIFKYNRVVVWEVVELRKLFVVFGLLFPLLFINNLSAKAETNLNAFSNKMYQSDKYTSIWDNQTGEFVEQRDTAPQFSIFSVAEPVPVQVNRFEDVYPLMKQGVENFKDTMIFKYTVNHPSGFDSAKHMNEIRQMIDKLTEDGSYISGTLAGFEYGIRYIPGISTSVELTIDYTYHHTAAQERELTMGINSIAAMISQTAKTDLDKVLAVNDYITRTYSYSFNTNLTPHSAYTMFKEGQGVCQAYALFAHRLLQELDMEVYYQTGEIIRDGELHAWNIVKVDGEWYNFDPTWNDPTADRKGQTTYEYLLVSDDIMNQSRTRDEHGLPRATSKKYDVLHTFSKYGTFGAYDEEDIYVSSVINADTGYTIKAYNKKTMEEVKKNFISGRNLVSHHGDIYYFGVYQTTNLYVWNRFDDTVKKVDDGIFDQLYIKGNTLYYREAGTNKIRSLVLNEAESIDRQVAKVEELINRLDEFSSDFEQALLNTNTMYSVLNEEARRLVKNRLKLQEFNELAKKQDILQETYKHYKQWNKLTSKQKAKVWKITFNGKVDNAMESPIGVFDRYGREVEGIHLEVYENTIIVKPSDPYRVGHLYYIVINEALENDKQTRLKQGVLATFIIFQ